MKNKLKEKIIVIFNKHNNVLVNDYINSLDENSTDVDARLKATTLVNNYLLKMRDEKNIKVYDKLDLLNHAVPEDKWLKNLTTIMKLK